MRWNIAQQSRVRTVAESYLRETSGVTRWPVRAINAYMKDVAWKLIQMEWCEVVEWVKRI